jgi:hypothetical protein
LAGESCHPVSSVDGKSQDFVIRAPVEAGIASANGSGERVPDNAPRLEKRRLVD